MTYVMKQILKVITNKTNDKGYHQNSGDHHCFENLATNNIVFLKNDIY